MGVRARVAPVCLARTPLGEHRMQEESREGALDRIGPHLIWIGLVVVLAVGTVVMLQGSGQESGHLPVLAAASLGH